MYVKSTIVCCHAVQGDLVLDLSELVIEFVLKLALNAKKLSDVEIDPSNKSVTHYYIHYVERLHINSEVL